MEASKLNPFELEAILKWLDTFELSRCRKKLNRDFSDCVLLAEILKFEFPNLVDLHNYNTCYSVQAKIDNWKTLNRKVLKKMQISLKTEDIEKLAQAESSCIEEVLFQVMNQVQVVKTSKSQTKLPEQSSDVMTVKVWKKVGDQVREVPQQMIQLSRYEDLLEKTEKLQKDVHEMVELVDALNIALDSKTKIIAELQEQFKKKQRRPLSIDSFKCSLANLF